MRNESRRRCDHVPSGFACCIGGLSVENAFEVAKGLIGDLVSVNHLELILAAPASECILLPSDRKQVYLDQNPANCKLRCNVRPG
jgi:hypothetical protein